MAPNTCASCHPVGKDSKPDDSGNNSKGESYEGTFIDTRQHVSDGRRATWIAIRRQLTPSPLVVVNRPPPTLEWYAEDGYQTADLSPPVYELPPRCLEE